MALRKHKKHVGEVNMSSMTDIIFMLLIFFMLTSTLVKYLPFTLPKSDQRTSAGIKTIVSIEKGGKLAVNNQPVSFNQLEALVRASLAIAADKANPTVTIAAEVGVPFGEVTKVMGVANRLKAKTILATEQNE
jgi:biopolymer transport protein ExbD